MLAVVMMTGEDKESGGAHPGLDQAFIHWDWAEGRDDHVENASRRDWPWDSEQSYHLLVQCRGHGQ